MKFWFLFVLTLSTYSFAQENVGEVYEMLSGAQGDHSFQKENWYCYHEHKGPTEDNLFLLSVISYEPMTFQFSESLNINGTYTRDNHGYYRQKLDSRYKLSLSFKLIEYLPDHMKIKFFNEAGNYLVCKPFDTGKWKDYHVRKGLVRNQEKENSDQDNSKENFEANPN